MHIEDRGAQRQRVTTWAMAALLAAALCGVARTANAASGTEPGVWQHHKLQFNYLGFGTRYSCIGMQHQLEELLTELGAAPGFKVIPGGCSDGFDKPTRLINMQLEFQSLSPIAESAAASGATPPQPVPGVWKHVAWGPRQPLDFGGGDCELVDEFRIKVMPLFAARDVKNDLTCIPYQDTSYLWGLSFEVFVAGPSHGAQPVSPAGA